LSFIECDAKIADVRIIGLETIEFEEKFTMPSILFVRIYTDDGVVGLGETCYLPSSCARVVHEFLAPRLIGKDPLAIAQHWRSTANAISRFGGRGAELRALAAVDVALWDILGQVANLPIYQLLGGVANESVPVYNTCAGPLYASISKHATPGEGSAAPAGIIYEDLIAAKDDAGALAESLLSEGITGMKIWPFDQFALKLGGSTINAETIEKALEPIKKIRDAVGDQIDVMIDGHGLWSLEPAKKIAHALEPYAPYWLEDLTLADPKVLASLRASTNSPISASEYLVNRNDVHAVLEAEGADFIMIDPTWAGGITGARDIAQLADLYGKPVTFHDCTGPVTLQSGIHLAISTPNAAHQEIVRAFLGTTYAEVINEEFSFKNGRVYPPQGPGLGITLQKDLQDREYAHSTKTFG